jgi:two-component sensor histidine kinase
MRRVPRLVCGRLRIGSMIERPRQSISRRLTRLIALAAIVAATLVPVVGVIHQFAVSSDAIENTKTVVEDSTIPVLSYLLWTVNRRQVEQLLRGLLADPVIAAVELTADGIAPLTFSEEGFRPARSVASQFVVTYNDGNTRHHIGRLTVWNRTPMELTLATSPILAGIIVGLALVSTLIGLFAVLVHRHVTTPLTALTRHADALRETAELPSWWEAELERDPALETYRLRLALDRALRLSHEEIASRKRTERDLAASLEEKEVLLQEIHHGVKNNLQLVMSFLSLQRAGVTDTSALQALEDSQNRVMSMAIIHEMLYQGDRSDSVMFDEYLASLTRGRHPAESPELAIAVRADEISVPIDTAVPCGLIVTELITNAIKHAFGAERSGKIVVGARREISDGCLVLRVEDDGRGLPGGWSLQSESTLGARIIDALTQQLRATISVESEPGSTRFAISVPLDPLRTGCAE